MISFGFTIFQLLRALGTKLAPGSLPPYAARNFGMGLLILGMLVLILGIYNHTRETHARRQRRRLLFEAGLIREKEATKVSSSLLIAFLLLLLGIGAILRVGFSIGPL
jgi:putative membrane protein